MKKGSMIKINNKGEIKDDQIQQWRRSQLETMIKKRNESDGKGRNDQYQQRRKEKEKDQNHTWI
jgi:uncharacterized membrane-anchored protein